MKEYDVIIIGGGASGCMTAMSISKIICSNANKFRSVAIIDSGKSLGKKIMVTGNGRCNLTNTNMSSEYFNQNIDKYLSRFDEKDTLAFFEKLGLETYADDESRVYPISNSAKSVVDVITQHISPDITAYVDHEVTEIKKVNDGFFVATSTAENFKCKKLVVAAGGNKMANALKEIGVEIKPFVPSLTALKCSDVKDLNGVKTSNVKVTVINKSGESKSEVGEVLFKDRGLSGIVVFNLSTIFARSSEYNGNVSIDLMPNLSIDDLCKKIAKRKLLNCNLDKLFVGMFVNSLANEIFRQCKMNTNINSNKLTDEQILILAKTIKNLKYNVVDAYDNNQVFSGGVKLADLDDNLMHKQIPNLYFTGEICNVDGVCGGYNLQWAWTSGKIVGDSL